jgi:hypothetical protein
LLNPRTSRSRHTARTRRRAQLGKQIGNSLGCQVVLDSESAGLFATILIRRPELAKPQLETLGNGGLRSQTAEDQLAGWIDPVWRQSTDHLAPDPLLEGIEICRWLRPTGTGNQYGDNGERG